MMLVSYLAHILRDSSHSIRVEHRQENLLTWLFQFQFPLALGLILSKLQYLCFSITNEQRNNYTITAST